MIKEEDKNLLIKDISARLPYGVKICYIFNGEECVSTIEKIDAFSYIWDNYNGCYHVREIKPYLFPLSSMTEEQFEEFSMISGWDVDIEDVRRGKFSCIGYVGFDCLYDAVDWFNKNHFDWRGLIPMELSIDCTNLNIY